MKIFFYFGNKQTALTSFQCNPIVSKNLILQETFAMIAQNIHAQQLFFLRQIHSASGYVIPYIQTLPQSFSLSGDFLITNQKNIGLAVVTADCAPVIAYDTQKYVIGIAHAGWRGAIAGVVESMLISLQINYGSHMQDMQVTIGPSARTCCYQVKHEVLQRIDVRTYLNNGSLVKKGERYFFDVPLYVKHTIALLGVLPAHINLSKAVCTICNNVYCSYRREGSDAGRNVSVVSMGE